VTFFAHSVHYLVVAGGLFGVLAMLTPQLIWRGETRVPRTAYEQRIADLRYAVETGMLGTGATVTRPVVRRTVAFSRTALPIAVTGSAAAAGAHAAVGPAHFEQSFPVAAFFVLAPVFQLLWALVAAERPRRTVLVTGAVVNAAFIALWAVTRTVGLPFRLLPGVEGVGPWDLFAVTSEAALVVACAVQLRQGPVVGDRRLGSWAHWSGAARAWLVVSLLALGLLSVTGAG